MRWYLLVLILYSYRVVLISNVFIQLYSRFVCVCVRACVCACVRACVRARVCRFQESTFHQCMVSLIGVGTIRIGDLAAATHGKLPRSYGSIPLEKLGLSGAKQQQQETKHSTL